MNRQPSTELQDGGVLKRHPGNVERLEGASSAHRRSQNEEPLKGMPTVRFGTRTIKNFPYLEHS